MATRNVDITTDPSNLVSTFALTTGTRYTLQNIDSNARIFLREAAVKPTGGALRGHVMGPAGAATCFGTVRPDGVSGIWVWTDQADGCKAVISEAPA